MYQSEEEKDEFGYLYAYVDVMSRLCYEGFICSIELTKGQLKILKSGLEWLFEDDGRF